MIQIEMKELDRKEAPYSTHVCQVTENAEVVGELFLTVNQSSGRIDDSATVPGKSAYLDGLVKTAVHQLFWKGIITLAYKKVNDQLSDYFGRYGFNKTETQEEVQFMIEDFIEATRCSHG